MSSNDSVILYIPEVDVYPDMVVDNLIDSTRMKCGYYKYNPKNYDIVSFVENI